MSDDIEKKLNKILEDVDVIKDRLTSDRELWDRKRTLPPQYSIHAKLDDISNNTRPKPSDDGCAYGCTAIITIACIGIIGYVYAPIFADLYRRHVDYVVQRINESREIKTENVMGTSEPEKFYEINGQRVYVEIDGKPVEEHFETGGQ